MQLHAFCGFALLVLLDGAFSNPKVPDRNQCPPDQVHCRYTRSCVLRFQFKCGNLACGQNKTLCGPPIENALNCTPGKGCEGRNSSLFSHEGGLDGRHPSNGSLSRKNDSSPNPVRGEDRRDDSDDNPFSSRESRDRGYDFDGSDLRRVLNETRLRRMLRRSFNHSILKERKDQGNGSFDGKDEDKCGRRYASCIQNALSNFMLLKSLDGKCCRMTENPQRFARELRNITREFRCPRGTKFCPFRFVFRGDGCIRVGRNCSAWIGNRSEDRNSSEPRWSPWGSKSPKGHKYCYLFNSHIPQKTPCRYPALIKVLAARNGTCPRGKRFCLSTFDCQPKEQDCGTQELIHWASKVFCGPTTRLCVGCKIFCRSKEESCPKAANMSMVLRKASLSLEPRNVGDEALRNLTKSGWSPFCLLRMPLLTSILNGLKQCLSREAHCHQIGFEEHKNCIQGEEFCQKLSSMARIFSKKNHETCHDLRTDPVKFEKKIRGNWTRKPWGGECPEGQVYCPTSMGCVPRDRLSECRADEQFCKAGLARAPWNMNHSSGPGETFCCISMSPAPNGSCSLRVIRRWLARKNKTCSPFGQCCPGGQNFSLSRMKCVNPEDRGDRIPDLNDTKCDDYDVFCKHRHVCLPKRANCTKPEKFDFFSVSPFANSSGWAALCQVLDPFSTMLHYSLGECERFLKRPNGTCRAKTSCPDEKEFCRRLGRCVPLGNCSSRPKPTRYKPLPRPTRPTRPTPPSRSTPPTRPSRPTRPTRPTRPANRSLCNASDLELRMLWAGEPLKNLFAPNQQVPRLVGLLATKEVGDDLRLKLQQGDWKEYKGCGRGRMLVVSTESILRLSSCVHGFLSFDIISSPPGSAHGQCADIPASPGFRETVGMALLPKLDHCAAGLVLTVDSRSIILQEDRPSNKEQFSRFVRVINNPVNCSVLEVNESLSCRVPRAFKLRYKQAVKRLGGQQLGVVMLGTDPPNQVRLKQFLPKARSAVDVPPLRFFNPVNLTSSFYPAANVVGRVTVTVAPACKASSPQEPNFNAVTQGDLPKIYRVYKSLSNVFKKGHPERIIVELFRRLNAADDLQLKRKIRNFVRSLLMPDRKDTCKAPGSGECSVGKREGELNVWIRPVNDPPSLHLAKGESFIYFPPVPENASDIEGKCIDVSVLTRTSQAVMDEFIRRRRGKELFERMAAGEVFAYRGTTPLIVDPDNRAPGLAITEAPNTTLGVWKYELNGDGVRRAIRINAGRRVLLLKPGDCIIFEPAGGLWGKEAARDFTYFKLRAWDRSDNRTSGNHQLNATFMDSQPAFSRHVAECVALRLGCDNVAGSELERDKCGQCTRVKRLKDRCVGCDGRAYSNMRKDECGNCVAAGAKPLYCSGSCKIPSYTDECGVCQNNGSEVSTKDCNGDCHGTAVLSECRPSVCVGGKTSKSVDLGKDRCGVCRGKNECVDCSGEVRGNKRLLCQQCVEPDEKSFQKCPEIIDIDVTAVNGDKSTQLRLTVAGVKETITCYLEGTGGSRYTLNLVKREARRKVILSTPTGIPRGKHALKCALDGSSNTIVYKEEIFVFSMPHILGVSPNETSVNTATNVTLTGTGFANTRSLHCVFFMNNGKILKLKATYVSAESIICSLPPNGRSQHGFVSVQFNSKDDKQTKAMAKRFSIYDLVPEPRKCEFSEKRNYVFVIFNREIECGSKRWENCSRYFNGATVNKLTGKSRCRCRRRMLLIQLAPDSRLRPGQTVTVLLRLINRQRSGYTKRSSPEESQLNCEDYPKPVQFTVKLSSPEEVGLCDSFTIFLDKNQRASMNWSAAFNSSSSATPADLEQLNARLANISSRQKRVWFSARDIEVGITYIITACGKEEFSGQVACDTVSVRRVGKNVPKIMSPTSRIVIGPSLRVKFRVKVQPPSCAKRNQRLMVYLWSCDDKGLEFNDESPVLTIGADQLYAGQELKCSLTAYVRDDASLRARARLTIVVKKKNMVAKIKGGEQRVMSAHDEAVCDGGASYDPNNLPGDPIYLWTCKCKHDDGWKSCIYRNKTTGHLKQVILPHESVVRIPPDTFPANKKCAVTLRYFKGDMNASTSVYFDVKAQEVPFVKIVKVFSKNDKVVFIAVVRSPLPDLKIEWSCKQKDEDGNLLDFDLEEVALVRFALIARKRPNKLVIKRRVALVFKRLQDGLNVKCKCKVSRDEVEAFAEEEVKDDLPPIEGNCREVERSEDGGITVEASDFEDPAGEVLQYRCGHTPKDGKPQVITSWSTSSTCENLDLPSGDPDNGHVVDVVVQARNTRGATVRTGCPVVVTPQNFSSQEMKNASEEISEKMNQNKMPEVRGQVQKMLRGSNDEEAKEGLLKSVATGSAHQVNKAVEKGDIPDNEEKNEYLKTLKLGLHGDEEEGESDQRIDEARKRSQALGDLEELVENLRKMDSAKRKESDDVSRRKRRSADNGEEEGGQVEAKTKEEVETTLSVFSALIQPSNFSNSSMAVKQIFVALVDDLGRGLCQGLTTGEPALVAESHIAVIRSEKNSFDTVDVNFTNVACENCTYKVQTSAQVLLGQSLKDRYETWDCDEDGCNGACVVSAQYPHDLLAAYDNGSSVSDVVYVKLFNPENAAPLSASGLSESVTFRIPLRNYSSSNDTVPVCHLWDEPSLTWKADGVTTTAIPNSGNGNAFVDCRSSKLGFMAVFAVNSSVFPSYTSTTPSPTVSTQQVTPEEHVYLQFKLVGNYDAIITDSNKPEFINKVTRAIADAMGIPTSRISNVDARPGSILVSFTLLPGGPGDTNVSTAESTLRELVTSENFSVTLADGRTLVADSASFQSSAIPFTTFTSQTPVPITTTTQYEEEPTRISSKLSTAALIGIILGSIVGVVLFIVGVMLIANTRSKFSKVNYTTPNEDENRLATLSAHHNEVVFEEIRKEEKESNEYPMINLRAEADIPLPGTPDHDQRKEK